MSASSASSDHARDIEEGRINTTTLITTARDTLDEKNDLSSPKTISGDTLLEPPARTWVERWQSWRTDTLAKPQKQNHKNVVRTLEEHPAGYPKTSWFLDSDEQFGIYRRFGFVHSRLLLIAQDELREMETDLMEMDNDDDTPKNLRYLASRDSDVHRKPAGGGRSRVELLVDLKKKTLEYGQLLIQAQTICAMPKPADRDRDSVRHFLNNQKALCGEDAKFIQNKEDLVTLRSGREHAWLDSAVETVLIWIRCKPIEYLFVSEDTKRKTLERKEMRYYTRSRINALVTVIITIVILALLVLPIYLLFRLTTMDKRSSTNTECIGVLLVCTLIFSAALSLFTKAKRHEILAAAAGYCAVLVVFVGNVSNNNSN